jgi:2-oxoglutarate dehydrogenase E1 component
VPIERLRSLGIRACTIPEDFNVHPLIKRIYATRLAAIKDGHGLDWAMGEVLAWSTLLTKGVHVRLSGEDVERGTFSHRHATLFD